MSPKSKNNIHTIYPQNTIVSNEQLQLKKGVQLHQQGYLIEAQAIYESLLNSNPKHFDSLHLLGVIAMQTKNFQLAISLIDKAIAIHNKNSDFYCNRGIALKGLNQFDAAIISYDRAIRLNPQNANAFYNRGIALAENGKLGAAAVSYDTAIRLKPNFAEAFSNRGIALQGLRKPVAAVASYDRAISIKPDYAEAYCNRGNALKTLNQFDAAVTNYNRAISLKPDYADAYSNLGSALHELKQFNAAISNCNQAIKLIPKHAAAFFNRGNSLQSLNQLDAARVSYECAISIKPDLAEAYSSLGQTLDALKQFDASMINYEKAIKINPNLDYLFGNMLHTRMKLCDWTNLELSISELVNNINSNKNISPSFAVLGLTGSLSIQRKASEIWANQRHPYNPALGPIPKQKKLNKIRIGYFSADFHNHATTYLMAELFELHDKNKFEVFAFSFGPDEHDEMRQRVSKMFDQFLDVRMKSDKEVAELSRALGISIAIDLKGFTTDARTGIFSYKAAPIQLSYLGFPGTMGIDYIDYLIADRTLIPTESQQHYSEKIVYLPNTYQVNDRQRKISDKIYTRAECGLPAEGFIFCCFNNNFKITPLVFDSWVRILKSVNGSVLWLFEENASSATNLRNEALKRGLNPARIVFAKRMKLAEHLARHKLAGLFLDTLPYNAHTTASDALWAGLPVITCVGESFAGRVASSLLNAIGLPELITKTPAAYEELAIELGTTSSKLLAIKDKLEANKLTTPLFNTELFTKNIESAYTQIYERYHSDLQPQHINI